MLPRIHAAPTFFASAALLAECRQLEDRLALNTPALMRQRCEFAPLETTPEPTATSVVEVPAPDDPYE
jgi:hypothetical protein